MYIGRVMGNATATVKHPSMEGAKLLLIMALQADGRTVEGDPILAVDSLGAGKGETVMITSDGIGTRELLGQPDVARPLVRVGNSRRMSEPSINIEQVVRDVLAELSAARGAASPPTPPSNSECAGTDRAATAAANSSSGAAPAAAPQPAPTNNELHIASRVVTMAEVAGRLGSVRRLVVSREAIVTPAVRDELLRRGIALAHADSSSVSPVVAVRLVLITAGGDFDPALLAAGLTREGFKVECEASDCIFAATDHLAAETVRPDTLGVLLTRHTAAGLCLANRLKGVRAVTGSDGPAVAAAAAAIGANLLVVDPRAGTFFQLKQILAEFGRGGVRACPRVFEARLA